MKFTRVDKVFKLFKNFIICFFIFFSISFFSQSKPVKSVSKKESSPTKNEEQILKITNQYIGNKEYNKALLFLAKHYNDFSKSLYVNWLYAYVSSLNNDNNQAEKKFKKAISIAPTDKNLQLDYARFLYKTGKINKVETILSKILDKNTTNVEFLLMQANISYWKGDIKNAQAKINRILEVYPNTDITKNLEEQLKVLTAFYAKTNFEYQTDSQPLIYYARHLMLTKYYSKYLNPSLETSKYRFSGQNEKALAIKVSNQFLFEKLKLTAKLTAGVYVNFIEQADWIGGVSLSKKLLKNTNLHLGYSKNSLISTIASTKINLTQNDVFGELDYSNKYFLMHAGYHHQFFKDNNYIQSTAAWILSQPIKVRNINFQFGYSFNYTDSKNVLFFYDSQGLGVYDPYFTPKEQEIHSGLFILNYKPTKKLALEAKLNYGFKASIRNPYPIQVTPTITEVGGFYDDTFTPIEFTGVINYSFSNRFIAKISYIDQETFFYSRENINLGLNFIFE